MAHPMVSDLQGLLLQVSKHIIKRNLIKNVIKIGLGSYSAVITKNSHNSCDFNTAKWIFI